MITAMIIIFTIGYLLIALEHKIHINKAAIAVLLGMTLWVMYSVCPDSMIMSTSAKSFKLFLERFPEVASLPAHEQCLKFISAFQIPHNLGDIVQIIFYLMAAMTIVELIDVHGGFACITNRIKTRNKVKLLVIISFITFFLSAILDNLTTAIVMTMLLRKIIFDKKERWIFASIVILAANSGGAWSPIGDVTTIMLWVNENVTTTSLIKYLLLPSIMSLVVPVIVVAFWLGKGDVKPQKNKAEEIEVKSESYITILERNIIFSIGVLGLVSIPVFKAITHLPPFMGALFALGLIWIYVAIMYERKTKMPEHKKMYIRRVIQRIDFATILFFLGILMAVAVLQNVGVLENVASFLDKKLHNVFTINIIIGALSSIVDNVPLVAGAMGMYEMPTPEALQNMQNAAYASQFMQDGSFWLFLAYCAGVGGSMLIIGSAAGVVVMGLEKITFAWYLRKITLIAMLGYAAGALTFALQSMIL